MTDFVNARAGDTEAHDSVCDATAEPQCAVCGNPSDTSRCLDCANEAYEDAHDRDEAARVDAYLDEERGLNSHQEEVTR